MSAQEEQAVDKQCETGITEVAEGPSICTPEESVFGTKMWMDTPFDETLGTVRRALDAEGFGIVGEIDVGQVLRAEPGVPFPRYVIIQAWYPTYARQALQADMDSGLVMPHNVIVLERSEGTVVAAVDPIAQFRLVDGSELHDLAVAIKKKLQAVLDRVARM
jgi:uncharacterized protein (DUF302 family)